MALNGKPDNRILAGHKSLKRDVQIHAAVTIVPARDHVIVMGEKENEITQFCVQLDARFIPIDENKVRLAFEGLAFHCIQKMRRAGLIK